MPKTKVLVIEDDRSLAEVLTYNLNVAGYEVLVATDGQDGLLKAQTKSPDIVLLDLMLPVVDGLDVCRRLRAGSATKDVPIIMLTAKGEESDELIGFSLGADDYVTKPFSPRELAVRVKAVVRRATPGAPKAERIEVGDLRIDAATREVAKSGNPLRLTATEFDLLWFLASHPRRVFSRQQLMESVWGYQASFDTGTVTVHIRRLREKIEADPSQPSHLETVWGVGYRFEP
jgi:DNA-binding response OmpR family regulator